MDPSRDDLCFLHVPSSMYRGYNPLLVKGGCLLGETINLHLERKSMPWLRVSTGQWTPSASRPTQRHVHSGRGYSVALRTRVNYGGEGITSHVIINRDSNRLVSWIQLLECIFCSGRLTESLSRTCATASCPVCGWKNRPMLISIPCRRVQAAPFCCCKGLEAHGPHRRERRIPTHRTLAQMVRIGEHNTDT